MSEKLRVLILEDSPADADLMIRTLEKGKLKFSPERVETKDAFLKKLREFSPDIILADYKVPSFGAMDALEIVKKETPLTPFIVVTGAVGEEEAAECIREGAWDYVLKMNPARLVPAVKGAMQRKKEIGEKEKAVDTLEKVNLFWSATFNSIEDSVCLLDLDRRILRCNEAAGALMGKKPDKLIGKICCEIVHGQKVPVEKCPVERMIKTGKREEEELLLDGKWFSVTADPVRDEKGKIVNVVHIMRDITENKKAQKEILREKDFSEKLINSLPGVFYIIDPKGKMLKWNKNLEEIIGYSSDEVAKKNALDFFAGEDKPRVIEKIMEVFLKGTSSVEADVITKAGNRLAYYFTGVRLVVDSKQYLLGTGIDITWQRESIKKLEESERFFQNVFDGMQDGLSVLDKDLNIVRTNKWMEKMYRTKMPICGKKCYDAYQNRSSVCPWCPSVKALQTGEKEVAEVPYPFASGKGEKGWILLSAFPLKDSEGNVTGIIEHIRDITEHKKSELQITRFRTFAEQAGQGFGMATLEGKIVYSNQVLCDFLEMGSVDRLLGTSVFDFYSGERLEKLKNEILPAVLKTGRWTGEIPLLTAGKKELEAIQSIFLMKDKDGKPEFFANVLTDITGRKKTEMELQKTIDELQNYKEVTVGRELQVIELKKVINELSKELGRPEPYDLSFSE